jgi:hypothetical protein
MLLVVVLDYLTREGQDGGMEAEFIVQGLRLQPADLAWLQQWIDEHPEWSRKRIARQLCQAWCWVDGRGRLKDFAARSLLLKLERRGQVKLPALRVQYRTARAPVAALANWEEPPAWSAGLSAITPVRLEPVPAGTAAARRWAFYLERYHYLGLRVVGENVGYLAVDRLEREVGCLLFGAAAWRCGPRDRRLGWSAPVRLERRERVVNNTRFLILPWVRVKHLASSLLGAVARRIDADWRQRYGHGVDWLETFVERDRFRGSCYRAANWECVGQTRGRGRQDREHQLRVPVKDVYLYELRHRRCR